MKPYGSNCNPKLGPWWAHDGPHNGPRNRLILSPSNGPIEGCNVFGPMMGPCLGPSIMVQYGPMLEPMTGPWWAHDGPMFGPTTGPRLSQWRAHDGPMTGVYHSITPLHFYFIFKTNILGRNVEISFLNPEKFQKIQKTHYWYNNIKPYKTNGFSTFIAKSHFWIMS